MTDWQCPHCGTYAPDTCVWCDDLHRERNDRRVVDR